MACSMFLKKMFKMVSFVRLRQDDKDSCRYKTKKKVRNAEVLCGINDSDVRFKLKQTTPINQFRINFQRHRIVSFFFQCHSFVCRAYKTFPHTGAVIVYIDIAIFVNCNHPLIHIRCPHTSVQLQISASRSLFVDFPKNT